MLVLALVELGQWLQLEAVAPASWNTPEVVGVVVEAVSLGMSGASTVEVVLILGTHLRVQMMYA